MLQINRGRLVGCMLTHRGVGVLKSKFPLRVFRMRAMESLCDWKGEFPSQSFARVRRATARSAGTAVYKVVHEDSEHCTVALRTHARNSGEEIWWAILDSNQ